MMISYLQVILAHLTRHYFGRTLHFDDIIGDIFPIHEIIVFCIFHILGDFDYLF